MPVRKDPPSRVRRPYRGYVELLETCMDGEWYSINTYSNRAFAWYVARKLEDGDYAVPDGTVAGDWQFQGRSYHTGELAGTSELFARYKEGTS